MTDLNALKCRIEDEHRFQEQSQIVPALWSNMFDITVDHTGEFTIRREIRHFRHCTRCHIDTVADCYTWPYLFIFNGLLLPMIDNM